MPVLCRERNRTPYNGSHTVITLLRTLQIISKWATWEHQGYFLWENSKCSQGVPIWNILVTWPGTLWMYWPFSFTEPHRNILGTFFQEIQDVPMDYLIRTPQPHHWEHCNQFGLENSECNCDVLDGFLVGTLSISLWCPFSVLTKDTTTCSQCDWVLVQGA